GRATDLGRLAALRNDPRECRARSRHARNGSRRHDLHGEHAQLLSTQLHPQRHSVRRGGPSEERGNADGGCVRGDAADRADHCRWGSPARGAGTERGVTDPKATFSTCFGAPFLPLNPNVYATMLGERIARHQSRVWLVNTGWTGGPPGVGSRMKIAYTRAML